MSCRPNPPREASCCFPAVAASTPDRATAIISPEDDLADYEQDLAERIMKLTTQEVNHVQQDLHGPSTSSDKDPLPSFTPSIAQSILEHIQAIPAKERTEYDQAVFLAPSYVHNPQFLTKFYHCQFYGHAADPIKSAAQQIVQHFRVKHQWFGMDALGRNVCQSLDFDSHPEDYKFLWTGACQPLKGGDQFGRPVLFVSPMKFYCQQPAAMFKKLWYLLMHIAMQHAPVAQRDGFVVIFYFLGQDRMTPWHFLHFTASDAPPLLECIPARKAAVHACYNHAALRPILYAFPKVMDWTGRLRFRAHYGSEMECRYAMKSYGIPDHCLPLRHFEDDTTEDPVPDMHKEYYHKIFLPDKRAREQAALQGRGVVVVATSRDVLLGRGWRIQQHAANSLLTRLVQEKYETYQQAAGYGQRRQVCQEIVDDLQENHGARFLKRSQDDESTDWMVVSQDEALEKVAVAFRSQTKLKKRKEEHLAKKKQRRASSSSRKKPRIIDGGTMPKVQDEGIKDRTPTSSPSEQELDELSLDLEKDDDSFLMDEHDDLK